MLETPSVLFAEARAAAVIRITVPRPDMPAVIGPAFRELKEVLRAQGIAPAGAVFVHHLRTDDVLFDFETGIAVDRPVLAVGRVHPGTLPAGRLARVNYRGDYQGLSTAWTTFRGWIEDNGHQRANDLWEVYVVGPDASGNPAEWRTELNQPIRA